MTASAAAWNYATRTYRSIAERVELGGNPLTDVPRILCATLLFLRAAHEAYADEQDMDKTSLGAPDHDEMVAFVRYAKNAIIHGPERITVVADEPIEPPEGHRIAFKVTGYEIDFDGPDASKNMNAGQREAARRYATRKASRGVKGGLLAEVWDAVRDTGEMIGVADEQLQRFEKTGIPVVL